LQLLSRALSRLPRPQPRSDLVSRTLATVRQRNRCAGRWPAWWPGFLAASSLAALITCLWVIVEAVLSFERAGGSEFLNLIGSYPHLLVQYPKDTALALLEALPLTSVALALASALIAYLFGVQFLTQRSLMRGWPGSNGGL